MNLLVFSDLYPTLAQKSGYFVYNQLKELANYVNVSVMVPRGLPVTYRSLYRPHGIRKELEFISALIKEPFPNSYEAGLVTPFFKLPTKHLLFCQGKFYMLQNKRIVRAAVESFRPDLVYSHQIFPSGAIGYYIKRKFGIPYIVYEHGVDVIGKKTGQGWALRNKLNLNFAQKVLEDASAVLTNTVRMKDVLLNTFKNLRVIVNHLGCNANNQRLFGEKTRTQDGSFNIVSLCYFEPRKGIQYAIRAINELRKRGHDIQYDIYGNGLYEAELRRITTAYNLQECVKFRGFLPNDQAVEVLSNYHLFLLPSWNEAFGVVYLEALAAGIPAIGCMGEGPEEINLYGNIIFMVPPRDVDALADMIEEVKRAYATVADRVALGQRVINEEFTWKKSAESVFEIISSIIGKAHA